MTQPTKTSNNASGGGQSWFPEIERQREAAVDWFYINWKDDETGTGWPHSQLYDRVTAWGGTIEAIRGLVELGESAHNPKISRAISWLKEIQREDGGWEIWETNQSTVESTAWGLITLRKTNHPIDDECIQDAVNFLVEAAQEQATGYAWGAAKDHNCRIYPTIVTIWALHGIRQEYSEGGAKWLKTVLNQDGGWGFRPEDDTSNVAMTTIGLYTLRLVNEFQIDSKQTEDAKKYILEAQRDDGSWENKSESWNVRGDGQVTMEHGTHPWAILALLETDISINHHQLLSGIQKLSEQQIPDGAFLYDQSDSEQNIWYTTNCIIALERYSKRLSSPEGVHALVESSVRDRFGHISEESKRTDKEVQEIKQMVDNLTSEVEEMSNHTRYSLPVAYILIVFVGLIATDIHTAIISFSASNFEPLVITTIGAVLSVVLALGIQRVRK